jgi:O2-independent ubiquinone biosynthesis protein UbiU
MPALPASQPAPIELVCPAGSLPALKAAVDGGANCVYLGMRDATNARNFAGLNFDRTAIENGIRYAHERGTKVLMAINTYPQAGQGERWRAAVDTAAAMGADAIIVADPGLMQYAARQHPALRLHLSVQGSATNYEAINLYREQFGIQRAVLPRVLSIDQVKQLLQHTEVEIEVFGFGSLCVMVEGRCQLSSYVTGESPNTHGVCSPAKAVRWQETPRGREARLGGVLIDVYREGESAGYPTLCKGRFDVADESSYYAIEEPTSLNTLDLLPQLLKLGVRAIKIEGRQRSPAYVAQVTKVWREAIDQCVAAGHRYAVKSQWMTSLDQVAEGQQHTLGAYHRSWK